MELFTLREIAATLKVSRATLQRLYKAGKIKALPGHKKPLVFSGEELQQIFGEPIRKEDEWFTINELAQVLNVNPHTIFRNLHLLNPLRLGPKIVRISPHAVKRAVGRDLKKGQRLLKVMEVAKALGISYNSVRRKADKGEFEWIRLGRTIRLIPKNRWVNPTILRLVRERLNLTPEQVAKASQELVPQYYEPISPEELMMWEKGIGEEPSLAQLETLAAIYNCPVGWFFLDNWPNNFGEGF